MNIKLTARFIITILLVNILIFFINISLGISAMIKNSDVGLSLLQPIIYNNKKIDPENFTRLFSENIVLSNGTIIINERGKTILDENNLWIQILDENGSEITNYKKPNNVQTKYNPIEIINAYKYLSGAEGMNSILVSSVIIDNRELSYIINFPERFVDKSIFMYNNEVLTNFIKDALSGVLIMDSVIALLGGFLFSRRLTKPVGTIIDSVKKLSSENYNFYFKEKGIYKDVFKNLNTLSQTLKRSETERKTNEKMREEWIANISHDIKTPLASIRGYSELINGDYDFSMEEVMEYGDIIHKKSLYITELVDDLNLSTRLKNNAIILKKENVNLVTLTKEVVIAILNDAKYSNANIEFTPNIDIANKDVDILLIKRCLTNLIFNALVHNDDDVKIKVTISKTDKIYIIIEDNGKGINKEDLNHIFDRYYRGN